MNWIEVVATVFGLLCVWLTVKRSIWCWPTGLVQVSLYIFIFYEAKLYSDMILHVFYVFMQFYGWHHWMYGGEDHKTLKVGTLPGSLPIWWLVVAAGTAAWGFIMARFTDAALPYPDAFTTAASLVAQWLMARKKLESWYFWIVVDIVATGVYWYKELYLTSGLYAVFLLLATMGFFEWRRALRNQLETQTVPHE